MNSVSEQKTSQTPEKARHVIAVDGPAGSGKSSVAKIIAEKIGFVHADSGAMYRTMTLALMEIAGENADFATLLSSAEKIEEAFRMCDVRFESGRQLNLIGGQDVGDRIRAADVTTKIRYIADNRKCRDSVNSLLRKFALSADLVVDGRDIGTVVFPHTPYKFYLDASVAVRAARRVREHELRGETVDPGRIALEIQQRDEQDKSRPFGALVRAQDAILIDTSDLEINSVVARIISYLQLKF